jgi:hypothetical protein
MGRRKKAKSAPRTNQKRERGRLLSVVRRQPEPSAPPADVEERFASELAQLDQFARSLAENRDLSDVLSMHDRAKALRCLAKEMAVDLAIQNKFAEHKLRAERRIGEILSEMVPHGGDRKSSRHAADLKLTDIGINSTQSSRCRRLARVPEDVLKEYIISRNEQGREISDQGVLRLEKMLATKKERNRRRRKDDQPTNDKSVSSATNGQLLDPEETPEELLAELKNHNQLLNGILTPACDSRRLALDTAQTRHVLHLLIESRDLIATLTRLLSPARR